MTTHDDDDMALPAGKMCGDCRHFKPKCEWLISCRPTNTRCDWAPSRFAAKAAVQDAPPPEHEWFKRSERDAFECCRQCGIVKRADGMNRPCRGKVRVELRTAATPGDPANVMRPEDGGLSEYTATQEDAPLPAEGESYTAARVAMIDRLRAALAEKDAALRLAVRAMRAPLDDWKGELERTALDAASAALGSDHD